MMSLSARDVDCLDVGANFFFRHLCGFVAPVAGSRLEMRRTMPEIVEAECLSRPARGDQRLIALRVTDAAIALFPFVLLGFWLMRVATVALRVRRELRGDVGAFKVMAEAARRFAARKTRVIHLAFHLLRIVMLAVRKSFQPELIELGRKADERAFGIDRHLVAGFAHATGFGGEVPLMAFLTSRVAGKLGFFVFGSRTGWSHVAEGAVLRFGFVLFAIVIERRLFFDDLRVDDLERRLSGRRAV